MSAGSARGAAGGRTPGTTTARFGSGKRESHDASIFYERFVPPEISSDTDINRAPEVDVIHHHDGRDMRHLPDRSVALVVTSPPYFAGKQYEASLGENGVPATYFEYLALLRDVFAECRRVLEPGGRIAVNVANLGRRPYRSLAGDVTEILQDLAFLLRGEVVWWKGRAAGGSCAWGTFQQPRNPVLRDVTERLVVASKGRFDRALTPKQRAADALPSTATISRDEFLEATTDLWEIPPESATRVGHPAPFPVALPQRLIDLYTYEGDVVLDPFMGSGSAAVAAVRTGRHYVGYDTDADYVRRAEERVAAEHERLAQQAVAPIRARVPATVPVTVDDATSAVEPADGPVAAAVREGHQAKDLARVVLEEAGFTDLRTNVKLTKLGVELAYVAVDRTGGEWAFDVSGAFTTSTAGLKRADTLWKALGKAAVLHEGRSDLPLVLLTTDLPARGSAGAAALQAVTGTGRPVSDAVALLDDDGRARLRAYAERGLPDP